MTAEREPARHRSITELVPYLQWVASAHLAACKRDGIDARFTETFRSEARQAWLYAIGRDRPGRKVTNVGPGDSRHQYRVAYDIAIFVDGKVQWEGIDDLWDRAGLLGEALGLEWGGSWKRFTDRPHFQAPGFTLTQLKTATPEQVNACLADYYRNHGFDRMVETSLA